MSKIKVRVKSPICSTVYSLITDSDDVLFSTKQYLLSLSLLHQSATAFSLTEESVKGDGDDDAEVVYNIVLEKQNLCDVTAQLEQLRDEFGLAPGSSTCINNGATRLHEIPAGSKKRKGIPDDVFLEAAEMTSDLTPTFDNVNSAGITAAPTEDNSLGNGKGIVAAEPNPLIPKPAAQELKFSKWQPLCRDPRIKMEKIIAFICLVSNDGKEWHFVAYPEGFVYAPQMTNNSFALPGSSTGRKKGSKQSSSIPMQFTPTLIQAIEKVSPSSISNARKNSEKVSQNVLGCAPITQVTTVTPWLVSEPNDTQKISNLSQLEIIPEENPRDWNEEFQVSREVVPETISDQIARDRSMCQTSTEFASAATEGATKIVEQAIKALNPEEEVETSRLYLSQGIFYTHGSDFGQPYAGITGPAVARKASKKDIAGVEQLMRRHCPGLSPILSTVIDYCGRRLIAQAPVPGIFRESDEPLIIYGQTEEKDDVRFNDKVDELMKALSESLHQKKHPVNKEGLELQTSLEVHGTKSTDGRIYAIDLYRLHVPDLLSESNELNLIRFEALEDFYVSNPDANKLNPDVWMSPEQLPEEYVKSQFPKDIEDVKAVSRHVREKILKNYVKNLVESSGVDPIDGTHLTFTMHRAGLNMRLLGALYEEAVSVKQNNLASVTLIEAIARCLKVQLRAKMERCDVYGDLTSEIQSFFYGFRVKQEPEIVGAVESRLKEHFRFKTLPDNWVKRFFPSLALFRLVSLKIGLQWSKEFKLLALNPVVNYAFPGSLVANEALEAGFRSLDAAIRAQIEENEKKETSSNETKEQTTDSSSEKASNEKDAENKTDQISESLTIIAEATSIVTQIYGSSHPEVAKVLHRAALLFFEYGNDVSQVIDFERKAITIIERVSGVDSYDTLAFYRHLAHYEMAAGHYLTAIELNKRAIELTNQLICDPSYSEANFPWKNIGTLLFEAKKIEIKQASKPWLKQAYEIAIKTPAGPNALLLFEYGQSLLLTGDLEGAIKLTEESSNAFEKNLGAENPNTIEAKNTLKALQSMKTTQDLAKKTVSGKSKNKKKGNSKTTTQTTAASPQVSSDTMNEITNFILNGGKVNIPQSFNSQASEKNSSAGELKKNKSKSKKNKKA